MHSRSRLVFVFTYHLNISFVACGLTPSPPPRRCVVLWLVSPRAFLCFCVAWLTHAESDLTLLHAQPKHNGHGRVSTRTQYSGGRPRAWLSLPPNDVSCALPFWGVLPLTFVCAYLYLPFPSPPPFPFVCRITPSHDAALGELKGALVRLQHDAETATRAALDSLDVALRSLDHGRATPSQFTSLVLAVRCGLISNATEGQLRRGALM